MIKHRLENKGLSKRNRFNTVSGLIFFITAMWIKGLPIEKTEPHDKLGSLGPLKWKDSSSMNADNIHKDLFGPSDYTLGLLGFLILERVPCLGNTWIHLCSVTLEKILESPLDSKEIKPVNPKGNQPWIFIGRTNAEAEAPILWQADASWLTGKVPDAGKDWGQEENGMAEDVMVDSITDSVDRSSEGQGSLAFARDRHRPAFECLSVSRGGMCQQWTSSKKTYTRMP